ncbi:MAG TPA: GTP-binding protein [Methanocorpusculum sp.]|nr:GTP-binding protein [Methanocorpusculum sp.]HJK01837.1 GTP-binding protein [Methanocorpusculum sp.]
MSLEEEIKAIEDEIRNTKYNKATSQHIGRLKAKLAKIKDEAVTRAMKSAGSSDGYAVKKSGDGTIVLVGFPSVGKSTLLNRLTRAESDVGAYAFTTLTVVPGLMEYKGAKIQILDIPGLIAGAAMGKGRGKEVIAVVRTADLIVILGDVFNGVHVDVLMHELYDAGIRINKTKPDITIKKTGFGGIHLNTVGSVNIDIEDVRAILAENKIMNADVLIRGNNVNQEDLIDSMMGNRMYIPAFIAINKVDLISERERQEVEYEMQEKYGVVPIMISAHADYNIDKLQEAIYEHLGFVRIYMKPYGEDADMEEPMIMRKGSTIKDICHRLHRDFVDQFRYAKIWGTSVKHNAAKVGLQHKVDDGDIVTIVTKL